MLKQYIFKCLLLLITGFVIVNCEKIFNPEPLVLPASSYDFCYLKSIPGSELHVALGSVEGASPKILAKGYNPVWSPDGQYIAWYSSCTIFVYNVEKEIVEYTIEEVADAQEPMWLPDSRRIAFLRPTYSEYGESTCIINIDGSNPVKLFDKHCSLYFFPDNYHFLYQPYSLFSDDDRSLHLTNLDKTIDEMWFDYDRVGSSTMDVENIDLDKNEITLVDANSSPQISLHYYKNTDKLDTLAIFETNLFTRPGVSLAHENEFVIYSDYAGSKRYKIILKNDTNISTLLTLDPSTPYLWPSPNNIIISPHDRLVLLSIFVKNPTDYFSSYYAAVYVLDLQTGKFIQLDKKGSSACCWNPLSRY